MMSDGNADSAFALTGLVAAAVFVAAEGVVILYRCSSAAGQVCAAVERSTMSSWMSHSPVASSSESDEIVKHQLTLIRLTQFEPNYRP